MIPHDQTAADGFEPIPATEARWPILLALLALVALLAVGALGAIDRAGRDRIESVSFTTD